MKKLVLVLLMGLTGCGALEQQQKLEAIQRKDDSIRTYLATNQPAVDSGALKSSTFYAGLTDELYRAPTSSVDVAYMDFYRGMASLSKQLEQKQITQEEFDRQRVALDLELKSAITAINRYRVELRDARRRDAESLYYQGTSRMQTCGAYSTNTTCRP